MISTEQTISRTDLILPRFLAGILFGLAAFLGFPTAAVALVSLFSGNWRAGLLIAIVWPILGVAVWLGRVLWSGRPIPMWFIFAFYGLIFAVPAVGLLSKGSWMGAVGSLALIGPILLMIWTGLRDSREKPSKPKAFDDEFA
jgi:hypothetical protein